MWVSYVRYHGAKIIQAGVLVRVRTISPLLGLFRETATLPVGKAFGCGPCEDWEDAMLPAWVLAQSACLVMGRMGAGC